MFVALPDMFKNIIEDVSPDFWRLQAVKLKLSHSNLLIINSYFPVDPRTIRFDDSQLLETFQHIRSILDKHEFDNVLWCGDINADFLRNTGHVNMVQEFIEENSFVASWDTFNVDYTHHHEVNGQSYISTIDHFLWNKDLCDKIVDSGVIHHPSNMYDHSPIYCKVDAENVVAENVTEKAQKPPKPSWQKQKIHEKENFVHQLDVLLSGLEVNDDIVNCQNVHCKDAAHINATDDLIIAVLESVDKAAKESLHQPSHQDKSKLRRNPVPGWSESVKPFKDDAFFWHQV